MSKRHPVVITVRSESTRTHRIRTIGRAVIIPITAAVFALSPMPWDHHGSTTHGTRPMPVAPAAPHTHTIER